MTRKKRKVSDQLRPCWIPREGPAMMVYVYVEGTSVHRDNCVGVLQVCLNLVFRICSPLSYEVEI